MNIGRAVKHFRSARGVTQTELADAVGSTSSYLSMIEKGQRMPTSEVAGRIAVALRVPVFMLYFVASDEADLSLTSKDLIASLSVEALNIARQPHDSTNQNQNEDHRGLPRPVDPSA